MVLVYQLLKIFPLCKGLTKRNQPWNPCATKKEETCAENTNKDTTAVVMKVPNNTHEFLKQWRQYGKNTTDKYGFLVKIGGQKLQEIFKLEISMGLLGEIVYVLHENWNTVDVNCIYAILYNLSLVKRFSLSLQFLSKDEKEAVTKLVNDLERCFQEEKGNTQTNLKEESFEVLRKSYQIKDS